MKKHKMNTFNQLTLEVKRIPKISSKINELELLLKSVTLLENDLEEMFKDLE
jgi:hypothetical protein